MAMNNDYRRTPYDSDRANYTENKKQLEVLIRKDHPKVVDLHSQIRKNEDVYKLAFIKAYDGRCAYCGASIDFVDKVMFEVDHYIPQTDRSRFRSKKDAGYMSNLILACHDCNRSKHDYSIPDNYLDKLHPDKDYICRVFDRDEKYYIRIADNYKEDEVITRFYNQLRLGNEMHRLDYLLLNMIGLRCMYQDDCHFSNLDKIIRLLIRKRNIGIPEK